MGGIWTGSGPKRCTFGPRYVSFFFFFSFFLHFYQFLGTIYHHNDPRPHPRSKRESVGSFFYPYSPPSLQTRVGGSFYTTTHPHPTLAPNASRWGSFLHYTTTDSTSASPGQTGLETRRVLIPRYVFFLFGFFYSVNQCKFSLLFIL